MANPNDKTNDDHKGAALFHEMAAILPEAHWVKGVQHLTDAQHKQAIETISAAYASLTVDERREFYTEAKATIANEGLKAHLDHPRFDKAVFVYQTGVLEEVKEIDAKMQAKLPELYKELHEQAAKDNAANPTAKPQKFWTDYIDLAERKDKDGNALPPKDIDKVKDLTPAERGILKSETYHDFELFKSNLDNHKHPDGLYGHVTDRLASKPIDDLLGKKVEAAPTPKVTVEQHVETTPVTQKQEVIVLPEPKKEDPKPNTWLGTDISGGKTPNTYGGAKIPGGFDYNSKTDAHVLTTTTTAGVILNPNDKVNFGVGGQFSTVNLSDADHNVNLNKATPAGNVNENGTYTGANAHLAGFNYTGALGKVDTKFDLDKNKTFSLGVGAQGGVGYVKSTIDNSEIPKSGVDLTNSVNSNPFPGNSAHGGVGYDVGAHTSLVYNPAHLSLQANANYLASPGTVKSTTVNFGLNEELNMSKVGFLPKGSTLDLHVGLAGGQTDITHNKSYSVTTTTTQPGGGDGPPVINPTGPTTGTGTGTSTTTTSMQKFDVSNADHADHFNFRPTAGFQLNIPINLGKGK